MNNTTSADIDTLVGLFKNGLMRLNGILYKDLGEVIKKAIVQWLNDRNFGGIPIDHVLNDWCGTVRFPDNTDVYIINLNYGGSDTGTDPCGGTILFSFDGATAKYLFDNVQCGE